MEHGTESTDSFNLDWFINISNLQYYLRELTMAEITTREFDTLKQGVDEIKKDVKGIQSTLNTHVQWEEGYQAQFRAKLDQMAEKTDNNTNKIEHHEERLDKYDVWKAGFTGHLKGIWFTIGSLIPVLLGIILKLMGVF